MRDCASGGRTEEEGGEGKLLKKFYSVKNVFTPRRVVLHNDGFGKFLGGRRGELELRVQWRRVRVVCLSFGPEGWAVEGRCGDGDGGNEADRGIILH